MYAYTIGNNNQRTTLNAYSIFDNSLKPFQNYTFKLYKYNKVIVEKLFTTEKGGNYVSR